MATPLLPDDIKPILLGFWEEVVGVLNNLTLTGGALTAMVGPIAVLFPQQLEGELRPHLGKKIAIIKTDSSTRPYRVRIPKQ